MPILEETAMLYKLIVTKEAMDAIRAKAEGQFKQTATLLPDGTWELFVSSETFFRLKEIAHPNETMNDTIIRLLNTAGKKLQ